MVLTTVRLLNLNFNLNAHMSDDITLVHKQAYTISLYKHNFFFKTLYVHLLQNAKPLGVQHTLHIGHQVDLFLRLLLPAAPLLFIRDVKRTLFLSHFSIFIIASEFMDLLSLVLLSNPIFVNTILFDISAFIKNSANMAFKVVYYTFKLQVFKAWLIVFLSYESLFGSSGGVSAPNKGHLISIEKLFLSAGWSEREAGEMFNISFFNKVTNRKLITDYFFKIYPLLKWVPSTGFSEVYCSSEGYFTNRSVKVFNSALS